MPSATSLPLALRTWARTFMWHAMSDFARFARDEGLSMQQFIALFILNSHSVQGVSMLGDQLGVSSAAASQMIERLVQQGLLERCEDPNDRRVRQVVLTARGRDLVERSAQARRSWVEAVARSLSPEEQKNISAALDRLTEAAQAIERQS